MKKPNEESKKQFERSMKSLFQIPKSELAEKIKKKTKKGKD